MAALLVAMEGFLVTTAAAVAGAGSGPGLALALEDVATGWAWAAVAAVEVAGTEMGVVVAVTVAKEVLGQMTDSPRFPLRVPH